MMIDWSLIDDLVAARRRYEEAFFAACRACDAAHPKVVSGSVLVSALQPTARGEVNLVELDGHDADGRPRWHMTAVERA